MPMKIAFIGGGNMGTAILSAVLEKGLAEQGDITVSDISEERLEFLKGKYGINVTRKNYLAVKGKDVVVFSIKPQTVTEVLPELKGKLLVGQLVLSIMAGIKIKTLYDGLEHKAVVRVMPNTPAQVYESMSVWTATADVSTAQKYSASSILKTIGKEIYVDDEGLLDKVTAVSGSGPAYFFLFVEALTQAAIDIGLSPDIAYELVLQTMTGSGKLMRESGIKPAELRKMVTSRGGTTAAALEVFEKGQFNDLVMKGLKAAYNRSVELGRGK
jgi:pyrroline-5-carboxylate reductase